MSKIAKLTGRFKEIELGEDGDEKIKFRIFPLINEDMLTFMDMADDKNSKEAFYHLLLVILKKDDATTTQEEVKKMPFKYTVEIINTATQLSGMGKLLDFENISKAPEKKNMSNLIKTSDGLSKAESLRRELIEEVKNE